MAPPKPAESGLPVNWSETLRLMAMLAALWAIMFIALFVLLVLAGSSGS
jgi:uncharacterized protein involved in response to NO